ncbi:MAG: hypothetical protein P4K80_00415 [Acidobacteriaceae bacterium]|nr:hypothetical protein [Acidobacteriaceae bacterium]
MSFATRSILIPAAVLSFALPLPAQQTPAPGSTDTGGGTVTGHIFCADTNAPAHFAKVMLKPVASSSTAAPSSTAVGGSQPSQNDTPSAAKPAQQTSAQVQKLRSDLKQLQANYAKSSQQITDLRSAINSDLDGSFTIAGVKPGTYYVHAVYSGYLDPVTQLSDEDFASTDPAMRSRIAKIPTVTINGNDSARADLRLERGASISGRLLYDDGSPATGWTVSVAPPSSPVQSALLVDMTSKLAVRSGSVSIIKTDDLGYYRIPALLAGEYVVRAIFVPSSDTSPRDFSDRDANFDVYSGSTFTLADAKKIKLSEGEGVTGFDITIPASHLHSISGHVVAQSDLHPLNSAYVLLTPKNTPLRGRSTQIHDDGSFCFKYLPNGVVYTLRVIAAADTKPAPASATTNSSTSKVRTAPKPEIVQSYGAASVTVDLENGDINNVSLAVPAVDNKPSAK